MLSSTVICVQFFVIYVQNSDSELIYGNFFDYTRNLTAVYNNPSHVFGEDLLRTAVFYLDELMELEEALEDEDEHKKALQMLTDLLCHGGPKHLKEIPYAKFIDAYNWTRKEIDDFSKYIEMTTETWNRLLKMVDKYKQSVVVNAVILCASQQTTEPPPGCGVYHKNFIVTPEWQELFSIAKNLSLINENLLYSSGHELFNNSRTYLEKIAALEDALDNNRFRSLDAVWELYLCGGPPHIKQIPYDKYVKFFNWTAKELDDYYSVIEETKRIYSVLVEELGILYDSDIVI